MSDRVRLDAVIIGGGIAGLSAALVLARCCHQVVVVDDGSPRNRAAEEVHGFITRDGVRPGELTSRARADLAKYGVTIVRNSVARVRAEADGFTVQIRGRGRLRGRTLLLATGVIDDIPLIPGIRAYYGQSIHHCPICDGWQWRGRRLVAYGAARHAAGLALHLLQWSPNVVVCAQSPVARTTRRTLARAGITIAHGTIVRLLGSAGRLRYVVLEDGARIQCDAMFFATGLRGRSALATSLGCALTDNECIGVTRRGRTSVAGVYAAGDVTGGVQQAIVAAAEGARAALAIHEYLRGPRRPRIV